MSLTMMLPESKIVFHINRIISFFFLTWNSFIVIFCCCRFLNGTFRCTGKTGLKKLKSCGYQYQTVASSCTGCFNTLAVEGGTKVSENHVHVFITTDVIVKPHNLHTWYNKDMKWQNMFLAMNLSLKECFVNVWQIFFTLKMSPQSQWSLWAHLPLLLVILWL